MAAWCSSERGIDATIRVGVVGPGLDTSAAWTARVIVIGLDVVAVTVAIVVGGDGHFQSRAIEIALGCREPAVDISREIFGAHAYEPVSDRTFRKALMKRRGG